MSLSAASLAWQVLGHPELLIGRPASKKERKEKEKMREDEVIVSLYDLEFPP